MKICYISNMSGPLRLFVVPQAEYIYKKHPEWEITFVCNNDDAFGASLPQYFRYIPIDISGKVEIKGIKTVAALKKLFKNEKFDMVIYATPNASLYASLAGKMAKVPVRVYLQWGIVYVARKGISRFLFKCMEKLICSRSTSVQPDSKTNLEFCRNEKLYDSKKSCVIWNGSAKGIDLNKFDISRKKEYREEIRKRYNISETDEVIGFVGKLCKEKGCEELLMAFKKISSHNSNVKLMFVGSGENDKTITAEIYEYFESNDNIVKTGNVKDVEKCLAAMDVFVLPSYREGFGMSVIEAQAMGVPVVVTEYPGPDCAVLNNVSGYVVRMYSTDDIVDAVNKIISNSDLNEKLSNAGRKFAEEHFEQNRFMYEVLKNRERLLGIDSDI